MKFDPNDETTWPTAPGLYVIRSHGGGIAVEYWSGTDWYDRSGEISSAYIGAWCGTDFDGPECDPAPVDDPAADATPDGMVRVRIAVAVDAEGGWNSCGWSDAAGDDELVEMAVDPMGDCVVTFVEADVPAMPKPATVIGKAVK